MNIYRSPSSGADNSESLDKLLCEIAESREHNFIAIAGDVNYRNIDWENGICRSSENSRDFMFLEAVKDAYLTQHITEPTRGRGSDTPSTLDVLLTLREDIIEELVVDSPLGKSDHALIWATFACNYKPKPVTKTRFQYDKADYDKLKEMMNVDWVSRLNSDGNTGNVDAMWVTFRDHLNEAIKTCIPTKTVTINGKNSNRNGRKYDRKTLSKIKRKNRLWDNYCKTQDGRVYLDYCKARNQVRSLTRKAEKNMEKAVCKESKKNPKKFWQFINRKTKSRSTIPDLLIEDEGDTSTGKPKYTANDGEKAHRFNQFFASVFNTETNDREREIPSRTKEKLKEITIGKELVKKKLLALKIGKSPGPDGLHPRVLKELSEVIDVPLTEIFNASLEFGQLPEDWRSANVTAIFKKGSRHVAGNYRPVSLTSIACKLLESIIREQMIKYMKSNKLFSKKQFGFLGGRSTTLQLLRVLDEWTAILDGGGAVDVIYFDFMKAFDKVSHSGLIMKLESYGIGGPLLTWIREFLTDRKQRVVINGVESDWAEVTSGVPQGSVLGPLLFVVFINDLPDVVDSGSSLYMFADDTKLFRAIASTSDRDTIQCDINEMNKWSDLWQMSYHPGKCHVLRLGKRPVEDLHDLYNSYELGGQTLDVVDSEKDLGVIIDASLSFEKHVSTKVKNANRILGLIRRSFRFLDKEMMVNLYKAMVRPHLEYANQVWSPRLVKHIDMIENVQIRATKLIPGLVRPKAKAKQGSHAGSDKAKVYDKVQEYQESLTKLKLPTLTYRRLRGDLIEVYKILTEKYDAEVCEGFIQLRNDDRTRGHTHKIFKNRPRLDVRKFSFPHRIVDVWNDLPEHVIQAKKIEIFEGRLDKFLCKQPMLYNYKENYKFGLKDTGSGYSESDLDLVQEA